MTITSPHAGTPWGAGPIRLDPDVAATAELQMLAVADLMVATGAIPAGLDPATRYGRAMSRVLRDGFDVVLDALRQ